MYESAPIFRFNDHREELVSTVVERVVEDTRDPLFSLNDAAYHEIKRLEKSRKKRHREQLGEWQRLARSLGRMGDGERVQHLRKLVTGYGWDVSGNFDPRVFKASTKLLPPLVTALLSPRKLAKLVTHPSQLISLDSLQDKVQIEGPVEKLRKAADLGTIVYVPTHLSNMDSIVFGYALERAGLPPATYGAGKNLFSNPVLSFFMQNLGAYKVDRRLRHGLYKHVLKAYSCALIENGYHSLFFPGGTRSRSGGIERHLKLGLVGTALEAYCRSLIGGKERRVFFVPATINYLVTLEAETLINDFLADAGKGRYIIEDDESTRLARMGSFVHKLLGMQGSVVIRFGDPIDPFGNAVDDEGESYDRQGRRVDPSTYVRNRDGEVVLDSSRDAQYTRELGEEIRKAYERDTVVMSTHVVAATCFELLRKAAPRSDVFTIVRQRDMLTASRDDLATDVMKLKDELRLLEKEGKIALGEFVRDASGGDVVERAIRAFGGYHSTPVLTPKRDGVGIGDPGLLLYYQNRLAAHGLAYDVISKRPMSLSRGGTR